MEKAYMIGKRRKERKFEKVEYLQFKDLRHIKDIN